MSSETARAAQPPATDRVFPRIVLALGAGVLVGLLFGESVQPLEIVGNAFIRLLQVNVLPYLLGSVIASLGGRGTAEIKLIARYGLGFLLSIWLIALVLVAASPLAFPGFGGASFLGVPEPVPAIDWLELYIPSNLFHALSNNLIPGVVLFGILAGLSLGQMSSERKDVLLRVLEAFNETMARISRIILHLTPVGLFAIAAVTAGQLRVEDVLRLQVWIHFYTGACVLLSFWILPGLVSRLTPVPFGRFLKATRSAVITAGAAGDVLVVLPLIVEAGKSLLVEMGVSNRDADGAVSVAVPLLYNFPHAGKVLTLAFLPFAAWFSGGALNVTQFAVLSSAGLMTLFGNLNASIPFLLDLLHLPADLFELFTMSSVINSRVGSMTAAMHTAAVAVLIAAAMLGRLRLSLRPLLRFGLLTSVVVAMFLVGTRATYTWLLPPTPSGLETLSSFEVRPPLVTATIDPGESRAPPPAGGRLDAVLTRGKLRVGFFPDAMPWAFVNASDHVVGYDIEAAHRLAAQLGVTLEFVRLSRTAVTQDLQDGRADIVMSGFTATVGRAREMELSHPYGSEHVGFLVRDHYRGRFATIATLRQGEGLSVGYPPLAQAREMVTHMMPLATSREFDAPDKAVDDRSIDVVVMSLERASYWSRVHPEYAAVRPAELTAGTLVVYGFPSGEIALRNLVDLWIETRRASGELDEAYEYWIRGRALRPNAGRRGLIRKILD